MWLYSDIHRLREKRERQRKRRREVREGQDSPTYTPEFNPHLPPKNPSVVLFRECSYGQWLPLAETCEDSARSGPGGDLQFYSNIHTDGQQTKVAHFKCFLWRLVKCNGRLLTWRTGCWSDSPVDELLQAQSPLLNEGLLKKALISTEWQLSLKGFSRQRWYYNLRVSVANASNRKDQKDMPPKYGIHNPHMLRCKTADISIDVYALWPGNKRHWKTQNGSAKPWHYKTVIST